MFAYDEREPDRVRFLDPPTRRCFPAPCTRRLLSEADRNNLNRVKRDDKGRRTPHDVAVQVEKAKQAIVSEAKATTASAKRVRKADQAHGIPSDMRSEHRSDIAPAAAAPPVATEPARSGPPAKPRPSFVDADNVVAFPISNIRSK